MGASVRWICASALIAPLGIVTLGIGGWTSAASSGSAGVAGLELQAQNFVVGSGSIAHFEFLVTADVPEIAPPTTTTTTTTTSTTTTTTTTTVAPTTTVGEGDGGGGPGTSSVPPALSTSTVPATTTTSTTTTTLPPLPDVHVQVRAHPLITERSGVAAAADGEPGPVIDILEFALDEVAVFDEATGERRIRLDVPIATGQPAIEHLDLIEPGVYPVTIRIQRDGLLVADHLTFLERRRDIGPGNGPLSLAVLASIADPGPQPTEAEQDAAHASLVNLADLLESTDIPITASIPPSHVGMSLADDPALTERLDVALEDRDLISSPEPALDPSAAVAAGVTNELAAFLDRGDALLRNAFPNADIRRDAWPADRLVTADGAAELQELGTSMLVVPYDHYVSLEGSLQGFTDTSLLVNAELPNSAIPLAIIDPVTEFIDPDRVTTDASRTTTDDAVRLMAEMSAHRHQLGPDLRGFVLTPPGFGIPDSEVLITLEQFVAEHPDFSFQPLASFSEAVNTFFVDGEAVTVGLADRPVISIDDRADRIKASRLMAADAGSMLPAIDPRHLTWPRSLDVALSTAVDAEASTDLIDGVDADTASVRGNVLRPEPFNFTLTARESSIPLRLENTRATPLTVEVRVTSEKLGVPDGNVTAILTPNSVTDVPLPVETRTNGVFPVEVEVLTPAGNLLHEPVVLTARVNTLTGLGRVFTVGAILVLATWWFTYFRSRHKRRTEEAMSASRDRHPASPESA